MLSAVSLGLATAAALMAWAPAAERRVSMTPAGLRLAVALEGPAESSDEAAELAASSGWPVERSTAAWAAVPVGELAGRQQPSDVARPWAAEHRASSVDGPSATRPVDSEQASTILTAPAAAPVGVGS